MAQPLIGPSEIIRLSWQNFRHHLRQYSEFMLIILLIGALSTAYGISIMTAVKEVTLTLVLMSGLLSIPISLVYSVVQLAFIDFTAKTLQGKPAKVSESLLIGAHKLIPFIWVSLLVGVIVFGGTLLLIVPGIIFSLWYLFATMQLVVDGTRGYAALKASRSLVIGRWWGVFWRVAVPTAFYYLVIQFVIWVIFLILGSFAGNPRLFLAPLPAGGGWATGLIRAIVPIVVYSFGLALTVAANLVLWLNLKRTRS